MAPAAMVAAACNNGGALQEASRYRANARLQQQRRRIQIVRAQDPALAESPTKAAPPPSVSDDRLAPRVEVKDGYWVLKPEFRKGTNPAEKVKLDKEPMKLFVENEVEELAKKSFDEIDSSKMGKDDVDSRLKWLGLFHRRKHQYGTFMMRLKLPNGVSTSAQVRFLANVIEKYGEKGCADVTTRQNWQIRGVVLQDVPAILKGLEEVGLSSLQSGMDNVRNPVGNPLAGIDPHEIIDTRPYNKALSDFIIANGRGNTDITNLPRKWNVCVVGSHDLFEHPHINDLAYIPAYRGGKFGFNLLVGGFFSPRRCAEAVPLDAWVPGEDIIPVCRAILETFRDLGFRGNRQKCRMMWLIDELGIEGFRSEVQKRMTQPLARAAKEDLLDKKWQRRDYLGVHPQKQEGLSFVGLHVPVGRLQAEEMLELARLADEYGSGELRLTVEQNVIVPNVERSRVASLLQEKLLKEKLSPWPSSFQAGLVACTGSQFCGQAIIETKARAQRLAEELERTLEMERPVRMHWTGCPNSCGQVQVADIGFMGCMARDPQSGKPVEGVHVFLRTRTPQEPQQQQLTQEEDDPQQQHQLAELVASDVPCKDLLPLVQKLLVQHFGAKMKA